MNTFPRGSTYPRLTTMGRKLLRFCPAQSYQPKQTPIVHAILYPYEMTASCKRSEVRLHSMLLIRVVYAEHFTPIRIRYTFIRIQRAHALSIDPGASGSQGAHPSYWPIYAHSINLSAPTKVGVAHILRLRQSSHAHQYPNRDFLAV